jgi:hypothetical protein
MLMAYQEFIFWTEGKQIGRRGRRILHAMLVHIKCFNKNLSINSVRIISNHINPLQAKLRVDH